MITVMLVDCLIVRLLYREDNEFLGSGSNQFEVKVFVKVNAFICESHKEGWGVKVNL